MDYEDALDWLYDRQRLGIKLGLEKVRALLAAIGATGSGVKVVHVAGTNGKGSVATLMADALHRSGHRTCLFTSPHLSDFTERIQVNGEPISRADVAAGLTMVRPHVEALDQAGTPPTFFEITFALAMHQCGLAAAEWLVLETGMGGRLDATNVLTPEVTIITNVGFDHARFLGDAIQQIAGEKAGIMKPGVPCITGATGAALEVIKRRSHEVRAPMSILGVDYRVMPAVNGLRLIRPDGEAQYDVKAAGAHQLDNAALVVAAADALRIAGHDIPVQAVQAALAETTIPGRLETLSWNGTPVLLDGAHNLEGAQSLRWHLGQAETHGFHLIIGFAEDKPWPEMMQQWVPLAAAVHGVALSSGRAVQPNAMAPHVPAPVPFSAAADVRAALDGAVAAGADMILVAGSLYLVGDARAVILGLDRERRRREQ